MATVAIFSNNVTTTISADITNVATSITVLDASIFNSEIHDGDGITYGFHEVATLTNGTNTEVIHITDANTTTDTLTVIRGREGTTGFAFVTGDLLETRVTADSMNGGFFGLDYSWYKGSPGTEAVDLVTERTSASHKAGGNYSVAIGSEASAMSTGAIAIGTTAASAETDVSGAIVIGFGAAINAGATDGLAIGEFAACDDLDCVALGAGSSAEIDGAVAIGRTAYATAAEGVVIGKYSSDNADTFTGGIVVGAQSVLWSNAEEGMVLGYNSEANAAQGIAIGANLVSNLAKTHIISGLSTIQQDDGQTDEINFFSGQETIVMSQIVDFKSVVGDLVAITLPTGGTFFPDEVGFIPTTVTSATVNPTITFGVTGDSTAIVTSMVTTVDTVRDRDVTAVAEADNGGVTSLTMSVTTGATATTFSGRVYFKGIFVED